MKIEIFDFDGDISHKGDQKIGSCDFHVSEQVLEKKASREIRIANCVDRVVSVSMQFNPV